MSIKIDGIIINSNLEIIGYTTSLDKEIVSPYDLLCYEDCFYQIQTIEVFDTGDEYIEYLSSEVGIEEKEIVSFMKFFNLTFKNKSHIYSLFVEEFN